MVGLRCNSCWPQVLVLTMNLITAFALFLSVRASHHDDLEAELPTWIVVCLYVNMAFMCVFVLHELYPMIELFQETWYLRCSLLSDFLWLRSLCVFATHRCVCRWVRLRKIFKRIRKRIRKHLGGQGKEADEELDAREEAKQQRYISSRSRRFSFAEAQYRQQLLSGEEQPDPIQQERRNPKREQEHSAGGSVVPKPHTGQEPSRHTYHACAHGSLLQRLRRRQKLENLLAEAVVVYLFGPRLRTAAKHRAATLRAVRVDGLAQRSHTEASAESCFVVDDSVLDDDASHQPLRRQNAVNLHASQLSASEPDQLSFRCDASGKVVTVCRKHLHTLQLQYPQCSETAMIEALLSASCHLGWARLLLHRKVRDVAKIQKLWRGHSVRSVSQRHGSERLAELYRDPERAMKIDRAASRKQHQSAIRISAVLKGHVIRMRLIRDCDGVAELTDPQREEKIQKAKVSKAMQKAQQAGAATALPPGRNMRRIEDVAATRIAATMKGHLVRRRVREGQVADYLDPDRDFVIKAAKIAMWDDPDAYLIRI
jgi:hypothetical protein